MSLSLTPRPASTLVDRFANWENFLAILTVATIAYAVVGVPNFLSLFNISEAIAGASERALIVLPMVLLIIARQIDLSVASILALTSVIFGVMTRAGVPLPVAIVASLLAGAPGMSADALIVIPSSPVVAYQGDGAYQVR